MRIVEVKTKRDINNKIISQNATLGDYKRQERYLSLVNNSVNYTNGLVSGGYTYKNDRDRINNLITSSNKLIDMSNALTIDGNGIKIIDKLLIVALTKNKGIEISSDGGINYQTIIDGNGLNMSILPAASEVANGLMSKEDKIKLNTLSKTDANQLGSVFYMDVNVNDH